MVKKFCGVTHIQGACRRLDEGSGRNGRVRHGQVRPEGRDLQAGYRADLADLP